MVLAGSSPRSQTAPRCSQLLRCRGANALFPSRPPTGTGVVDNGRTLTESDSFKCEEPAAFLKPLIFSEDKRHLHHWDVFDFKEEAEKGFRVGGQKKRKKDVRVRPAVVLGKTSSDVLCERSQHTYTVTLSLTHTDSPPDGWVRRPSSGRQSHSRSSSLHWLTHV